MATGSVSPRRADTRRNHELILAAAAESLATSGDVSFNAIAKAAGVGIGALPWFLANADLAAGRITRVLPDYRLAGGTSYLVYPPAKPLAPKLVAFCSYLLEHAPRLIVQPV